MTLSPHRFATLAPLACALGGEAYAGGQRALAPAPGHRSADRSVSLRLDGDRVLVHSFGAADWREVLDWLRGAGWIDTENRLCGEGGRWPTAPARADRTRAERISAARALWAAGGPLSAPGAAARHCHGRGIDPEGLIALRAHPAAPTAVYRNAGLRLPALLAAVRDADGELTAVEVTYLDARGVRSRLAHPSRKVVGVLPAGAAVRLAPAAVHMLVGEGVFTTLSAMARFGLPGWALLSTSNLRRWRPPAPVRRLLIAGDRGPDGERSAAVLRAAAWKAGVPAEIALPPIGAGDWNDLLCAEGGKEGRGGAPGPEGRSLPAGREPAHDHHRSP
jgi:putative DNA primase/helicase